MTCTYFDFVLQMSYETTTVSRYDDLSTSRITAQSNTTKYNKKLKRRGVSTRSLYPWERVNARRDLLIGVSEEIESGL